MENFGENLFNWLSTQFTALALIAVVIVIIPFIIKRHWTGLAAALVCCAIALVFVNNPSLLMDIGKFLFDKATGK